VTFDEWWGRPRDHVEPHPKLQAAKTIAEAGIEEGRKPMSGTVVAPASLKDAEPEKPTPGGRDDV
jgi:hypothetical protein